MAVRSVEAHDGQQDNLVRSGRIWVISAQLTLRRLSAVSLLPYAFGYI